MPTRSSSRKETSTSSAKSTRPKKNRVSKRSIKSTVEKPKSSRSSGKQGIAQKTGKKLQKVTATRATVKKIPTSASETITTKPSKKPVWQQPIFYLFLGILGINLSLAGGLYWLYSRTVLSFKASPSIIADANLRGPQPTEVVITSAQIDLPITPAQIKDGVWEIPELTAGHLYTSARPGEGNNIVVYAHNKKKLFGPLIQVKVGDVISIKTDKNTTYEYTVAERVIVKPDQIELVSPTDHEVLTVYTCTGLFDSQRLVLKAYPTRVSSGS